MDLEDDFYLKSLCERLSEFAALRGVSTEDVVSIRLRALQADGTKAYVAPTTHEEAIKLVGVHSVPSNVPYFGAEYLPGGFRAYWRDQSSPVWIPHEDGLEYIGLILGIMGAIEPTLHGIQWLVNKLKGKPTPDIHQPYLVHTVQLEHRFLKQGTVKQIVTCKSVDLIINDADTFRRLLQPKTSRRNDVPRAPTRAPVNETTTPAAQANTEIMAQIGTRQITN